MEELFRTAAGLIKMITMIFLMIVDNDGAVDVDGDDDNAHGDDGQVCPDNDLAHA